MHTVHMNTSTTQNSHWILICSAVGVVAALAVVSTLTRRQENVVVNPKSVRFSSPHYTKTPKTVNMTTPMRNVHYMRKQVQNVCARMT